MKEERALKRGRERERETEEEGGKEGWRMKVCVMEGRGGKADERDKDSDE